MAIWVLITLVAQFFNALAVTLDKHLLSNLKLRPLNYAFYSGIFQVAYLLLLPLAVWFFPQYLSLPDPITVAVGIGAGMLFVYALVCLYKAEERGEISRMAAVVGTLTPIFTLLLAHFFLGEHLTGRQMGAFGFLVAGGFIISAEFKRGKWREISGLRFAVAAGWGFAIYYVLIAWLYRQSSFLTGFLLLQVGGFLGAASLLLSADNRRAIFDQSRRGTSVQKRKPAFFFVFNKFLAATGAILVQYAISLGSVTIINALQSAQYAFILLFTLLVARKKPNLFREPTAWGVVAQKGFAIIIIAWGLFLII